MIRMLFALAASLVLVAAPDSHHAPQPEEPKQIRVLVLIGGGYHDFTANIAALLSGLNDRSDEAYEFQVLGLAGADVPSEWSQHEIDLNDPDIFTRYDTIMAYTQGRLDEFTPDVRDRFLRYFHDGGGYVAIHSAADSHPGWEEYDRMLGGRFESHPPSGEIIVEIDVTEHELMRDLPREWALMDEFYHLKGVDEESMLVLMRGRSPGDDADAPRRPVTWEKNFGHGRVFYTILGHGIETHQDERFHALIGRALRWSASAPLPDSDGTYTLFDGTSLDGWSMTGPGEFVVEDDGVLLATGGMGMLWYHERRFRDFELTVEWKTEKREDNSGVFVRFHEPPESPWDAVHKGHEIQILDAEEGMRMTGAIYNHAPATARSSNPPGEWNTFLITLRGDMYTVVLNGVTVCEWTGPPERHGREGYIGLQNHSSPVRFRNIRVRPLDADD